MTTLDDLTKLTGDASTLIEQHDDDNEPYCPTCGMLDEDCECGFNPEDDDLNNDDDY